MTDQYKPQNNTPYRKADEKLEESINQFKELINSFLLTNHLRKVFIIIIKTCTTYYKFLRLCRFGPGRIMSSTWRHAYIYIHIYI